MNSEMRNRVLRALRGANGLRGRQLASQLDMPEPSVRRIIGELRADGWDIRTTYFGYKLSETPRNASLSQPVAQQSASY
jgi:biotin operon repressor